MSLQNPNFSPLMFRGPGISEAAVSSGLLDQASGDRESCGPTSQLNAAVVRGYVERDVAEAIQEAVVDDRKYDEFWTPVTGKDFDTWPNRPGLLHEIMTSDFGIAFGFDIVFDTDAQMVLEALAQRLDAGYAAVLHGRSATGPHSRTAFAQSNGAGSEFYLHDSKYPEVSGNYDYGRLGEFQLEKAAIIY